MDFLDNIFNTLLGKMELRKFYLVVIPFMIIHFITRFSVITLIERGIKFESKFTTRASHSFYTGLYFLSSWLFSGLCLYNSNINPLHIIKNIELLNKTEDNSSLMIIYLLYELSFYVTSLIYPYIESLFIYLFYFIF
jgi:hypothetical protein